MCLKLVLSTISADVQALCSAGGEFSLLQNLTGPLADDQAHHVLRVANSLFLQQGMTFNPEFLHLVRKYFKAEVETVNFSESVAVAKQINSWVENRTEGESVPTRLPLGHMTTTPSPHGCLQVRSESCCQPRTWAATPSSRW